MWLATGFLNGLRDLLCEKRIHRHRVLRQESPPLHGHAAPRAARLRLPNQLIERFGSRTIRSLTNIQRGACFSCNHVHRAGRCFNESDRRHDPRKALCHVLHGKNPLRSRGKRVVPQIHRCRARVVRLS